MIPDPDFPRVLFVTSEARPLIKTGGLADVSGALPAALRELGADVRILLPSYPSVLAGARNVRPLHRVEPLPDVGSVQLLAGELPGNGVPLLIVDYPPFFERDGGPYQGADKRDWPDNARRFALLSRVAAMLGSAANPLEFKPDVVHCNDWQAGLAPAFLHYLPAPHAATVMTIHNLAFQGIFPPETTAEVGLPAESFSIQGVEYYGNLSFLKAGLYYADHITTVSPHYAWEIQHEPLGFGMQGLLYDRREQLSGIVNGIDGEEWNPARDPLIARRYSAARLGGKAANKRALQEQLGLTVDPDIPLLGVVSRITYQKGSDLLLGILPDLLREPVQLVLLGSGEAEMERSFQRLSHAHPGVLATVIGFDEALSHLIEAGADLFLMPSRFEPCGLNQMYSQCYGTPPVVHATGGLVDTVADAAPAALADGSATGFVFGELSPTALLEAVRRALALFRDKKAWKRLQQAGMARDFSWQRSAAEYLALYQALKKY